MPRPIHYKAAASRWAFPCFHAEAGPWLAVYREQGGAGSLPPYPRKTTDLQKVTCPACWRQVFAMAAARARAQEEDE